ncbi:hypothetical protein HZB78_03210 [Candidatus Collierbacteria bacterium]|nr:hypothetical protein [Candidatus Collierbacteria bacterium]
MTPLEVFNKATHFAGLMKTCGADTKFGRDSLVIPSITPGMKIHANRYPEEAQKSISEIRYSVLPAFSLTGNMKVSASEMDTSYLFVTIRGWPDPMIFANTILTKEPGRSHEKLWKVAADIGVNLEFQPTQTAIQYFTELETFVTRDNPNKLNFIKARTYEVNPDTVVDTADCMLACLRAAISRKYATPRN